MNKTELLQQWHERKGSEPWTVEEIAELIADASHVGETIGKKFERERIVELLKVEVSEWLSHDGVCDCKIKGEEGLRLVRVIETNGEQK